MVGGEQVHTFLKWQWRSLLPFSVWSSFPPSEPLHSMIYNGNFFFFFFLSCMSSIDGSSSTPDSLDAFLTPG